MKSELKSVSVKFFSVLDILGWRPSTMNEKGVHIFVTPECWGNKMNTVLTNN